MNCQWEKDDDQLACTRCHHRYPGRLPDGTLTFPCPTDQSQFPVWECTGGKGAGDFLHDAILKWVGEGPTRACGCVDRINQMNAWGPAGCREHLDEIVDWLVEEAAKRSWWKYAVAVPGSRYFIERMVLGAMGKAEAGCD
jgi:hypothetical protein